MSKLSRTRKAICRISHLGELPNYMIQKPIRYFSTWKTDYRFNKKIEKRFNSYSKYKTFSNKEVCLPCKYSEALKLFSIWQLGLKPYAYKSLYLKEM